MAATWAAQGVALQPYLGVFSALLTILQVVFITLGVLLALVLLLLIMALIAPTYVKLTYQDEAFTAVAGLLFVRVYLYPKFYIMWDMSKFETEAQTAARLAEKEAKRLAKKAKKDAEREGKIAQKDAAKGGKITLDIIVSLLQTAGRATKLILNALRIEDIRLWVPVQETDPAKTAITYGKTNAWLYGSLAILNNFLYLDFKELQITPIFEENVQRSAYFSCKISARLFIIVVVAIRLLLMLYREKELLAFFLKSKPKSKSSNAQKAKSATS